MCLCVCAHTRVFLREPKRRPRFEKCRDLQRNHVAEEEPLPVFVLHLVKLRTYSIRQIQRRKSISAYDHMFWYVLIGTLSRPADVCAPTHRSVALCMCLLSTSYTGLL